MYLFTLLTSLLPTRLQGAAKAVYPAILTAVGVVGQWVATGAFNGPELRTAVTGGALALLTYFLPNR